MSDGNDNADPLKLVLHHMEEQLDDRVDALSEAGPSSGESTADLIHLEETLSSAQDKAKKLVTLRLKLEEEAASATQDEDAGASGAAPPDAPPDSTADATPPA